MKKKFLQKGPPFWRDGEGCFFVSHWDLSERREARDKSIFPIFLVTVLFSLLLDWTILFPLLLFFLPLFRLDRKRTIESFDQKRDWGSGETISTQTSTTKHKQFQILRKFNKYEVNILCWPPKANCLYFVSFPQMDCGPANKSSVSATDTFSGNFHTSNFWL